MHGVQALRACLFRREDQRIQSRSSRIKVVLVDIPEIPVPILTEGCDYCFGNPACVTVCLPRPSSGRTWRPSRPGEGFGSQGNRPCVARIREPLRCGVATVKVKGFSVVRDVFGAGLVELEVGEPETVKATSPPCSRNSASPSRRCWWTGNRGNHPAASRLERRSHIVDADVDRPVKTGDELTLIFPIGGGRS